ncbi:MAG TPA: hypothetical protein VE173_16025, partial [Longimicrobiales bacterium]|nr:hypothetical protein [Longimicrobiales bacterium]
IAAVPGPIFAERSQGTNRLIRDGAVFLSRPEDVLELVEKRVVPGELPLERGEPAGLGPDALVVWTALEGGARGVDELARAGGLGTGRTLSALADLELGGWIEREPGMRFQRAEVRVAGSSAGGASP